jgi:hypothetical protein
MSISTVLEHPSLSFTMALQTLHYGAKLHLNSSCSIKFWPEWSTIIWTCGQLYWLVLCILSDGSEEVRVLLAVWEAWALCTITYHHSPEVLCDPSQRLHCVRACWTCQNTCLCVYNWTMKSGQQNVIACSQDTYCLLRWEITCYPPKDKIHSKNSALHS